MFPAAKSTGKIRGDFFNLFLIYFPEELISFVYGNTRVNFIK